ncbi:CAZyme family GH30 [Purpureocillium lilacinum]|uniref:CAZyme family GH30 n=1 Tax=Purpureocillium lilacinum TaxID=33203 RepID=A0ABR0BX29_PURLI|nr:CAZyme family GH30 [Purpureocillium lilacinum]
MQLRIILVFAVALATSPTVVADTMVYIHMLSNWGTWDGWGTSLAWWAKRFGDRDDLADVFFTLNSTQFSSETLPGMGMTIARYNAGACSRNKISGRSMVESPNIVHSRQMEGFWLDGNDSDSSTASWDWSVDANQRAMLQKARARGADRFELFSNSPMWWMCQNDNPSGSNCLNVPIQHCNDENLQPSYRQEHAVYLATIAKYARDNWGVAFESVSLFNEPSSHTWIGYLNDFEAWVAAKAGYGNWGTQEGCHINWDTMPVLIKALRRELNSRGLTGALIAAADENSYRQAIDTWHVLDDAAVLGEVQRVNVHSYWDGQRDVLRDLVLGHGQKLWMSEYGDGDDTGHELAKTLMLDFRWLRPTAWVYWQVLDKGGWGLIDAENDNGRLEEATQKYFVLLQFTRHIRPGMRILDGGAENVVAAYDSAAKRLVVVVANWGSRQDFKFDLQRFATSSAHGPPLRRWSTKMGRGGDRYAYSEFHEDPVFGDTVFVQNIDANTVATFEFDGITTSDFYSIKVNATWAPDGVLKQSDFYGGTNPRAAVSFVPSLVALSGPVKIEKMWFRSGDRLDYIRLDISDGGETKPAPIYHGSDGGGHGVDMTLGSDEYWTEAELCQGDRPNGWGTGIYYIKAMTSEGRSLEAGHKTRDCHTFKAPMRWQIVGTVAWEGREIDGLSFVYGPR